MRRRDELRQEMRREKEEAERDTDCAELSSFLDGVAALPSPAQSLDEEKDKPPQPPEQEDNALADFFSEISTVKAKPIVLAAATESGASAASTDKDKEEGGVEVDEEVEELTLTEKYVSQDLGTGQAQCARLLANHHEWRNLNPFYVLQLDVDANVEDIKLRYKKLSLKVHPDRMREIADARVAFEYVKEAYNKLLDEDQRRTVSMHIDNITTELKRERKRLLAKGVRVYDR
jgi:hypothetical protein